DRYPPAAWRPSPRTRTQPPRRSARSLDAPAAPRGAARHARRGSRAPLRTRAPSRRRRTASRAARRARARGGGCRARTIRTRRRGTSDLRRRVVRRAPRGGDTRRRSAWPPPAARSTIRGEEPSAKQVVLDDAVDRAQPVAVVDLLAFG